MDKYINKVICGDCLEVLKQVPDNNVNLLMMDPPWNCGKDYGVVKENLNYEEYQNFIKEIIKLGSRVSNNNLVIVLGSEIIKQWWINFEDSKLIIINKGAISRIKIKNFFLQWKALLTNCKSNIPLEDLWLDIRWPGEGYFFNEPRYGHPAMTPLKLMKKCINIFTKENDIVLDPFLGTGTTAVAAIETGRRFIGIEINEAYCSIARKRIELAYEKKGQVEIFK